MARKTPPLNPQLPMVDPNTGQPTPFFMQWWQEQIRSNAAIPDVSTPAAVSAILDVITGGTEGAVLYRGNEIWEVLVPGTDGQILTTQGVANPPTWGNISNVLDKTLTDGDTWGNVLFRGETGWEVLAPGTDGQGLVTRGPDADIEWGDVSSELVSAALFLEKRESVQGTWTFANTVQEGDLIVLFGSTDVENGVAKLISGFEQIDVRADSSPSAIGQYKKITAGDLPFASVAMPDFGSSTHNVQWVGMHFRGAGDVVTTVPGRVDGGGTSIQPPDITTDEDFSLVVIMGGLDDDPSAVITHPAGFTTATADYGAFNSKSMMAAGVFETAGLVEPDPFLSSLSDGWTAMTVAFGPGPFVPVTKWIGLSDTPGSITADAMVVGDSAGTALDMVTLSDYLDDRLGSAHGNILQRGSTGWEVVAPGTDGTILATNGSSADVAWEALTNLLDDLGTTQGAIAYRNASQWVILPPGTSGQFLQTQGPAANPLWATGGGGGGASAINDLSDVDTATVAPTDGQALVWSAADSEWQPGTVSGGGGGSVVVDDALIMEKTTYDLSVTTLDSGNEITIDMSGYDYAEIDVTEAAASSSDTIAVRVGIGGGDSGASDYETWLQNEGFSQNSLATNFLRVTGDGTAQLGGTVRVAGFNNAGIRTRASGLASQTSTMYSIDGYRATAQADDTLVIFARNGNAFTGGGLVVRKYKISDVRTAELSGVVSVPYSILMDEKRKDLPPLVADFPTSVSYNSATGTITQNADGYLELENTSGSPAENKKIMWLRPFDPALVTQIECVIDWTPTANFTDAGLVFRDSVGADHVVIGGGTLSGTANEAIRRLFFAASGSYSTGAANDDGYANRTVYLRLTYVPTENTWRLTYSTDGMRYIYHSNTNLAGYDQWGFVVPHNDTLVVRTLYAKSEFDPTFSIPFSAASVSVAGLLGAREVVQNIVPDNTVTEYVIDISGHEDIELFIANTTTLASGIMRFALSDDGGSTRQNLDWGVVGTSQTDGHPTAQVEIANRSSLVGHGPVRGAIRNHRLSAVPTTFELHRRDSSNTAYRYDGGTDAAALTTHLIIESTGGNWTAGQIAVTGLPVSA